MDSVEWLKASHLMRGNTYQKFTLTIKDVEKPGHGRVYENKQPIDGYIIHFEETGKQFVIKEKSTNIKLIRAQLGESWPGQKLTLFPVVGDWFGDKNLLGIRIWVDEKNPRPKIASKDMGKAIVGFQVGSKQEREYGDTEKQDGPNGELFEKSEGGTEH